MRQDFGDDSVSIVSGLEDEIDEWAALNKYAVLRSFVESQDKKLANKDRQVAMREELEKQQEEFRERQELFKQNQKKYAKE